MRPLTLLKEAHMRAYPIIQASLRSCGLYFHEILTPAKAMPPFAITPLKAKGRLLLRPISCLLSAFYWALEEEAEAGSTSLKFTTQPPFPFKGAV